MHPPLAFVPFRQADELPALTDPQAQAQEPQPTGTYAPTLPYAAAPAPASEGGGSELGAGRSTHPASEVALALVLLLASVHLQVFRRRAHPSP